MFDSSSAAGAQPMAASSRFPLRAIVRAILCVSIAAGGCNRGQGFGGRVNHVLPPEEAHYGAAYAEWSARWWQWVIEHPRTNHPLYDETGAYAAEGQINPVWFLGGIFRPWGQPTNGTVVRNITIPSGVALFFPVINVQSSSDTCSGPNAPVSFTELRDFARDAVENVADLDCELDGAVILHSPDLPGAVRWRAQAPEFSALVPGDNIFADSCDGVPITPRTMGPIASDGIWVMIEPLPPGGHTLTFSGTFPTGGPFHVDVTYHITVLR
jgi:hypothetical protein